MLLPKNQLYGEHFFWYVRMYKYMVKRQVFFYPCEYNTSTSLIQNPVLEGVFLVLKLTFQGVSNFEMLFGCQILKHTFNEDTSGS